MKFFNKIRQNLLSENRLIRYLFYAAGEILLVVIGILIALQINNWNEQQKENKKETHYLNALKYDLEANQSELERVIKISKRTSTAADSVLRLSEDFKNIDLGDLTKLIMRTTHYSIFNNKNATVRELLATGDLSLIKNDSLRSYMANWESEITDIQSFEQPNTDNALSNTKIILSHLDLYKNRLGKPAADRPMISDLFANRAFMNGLANRFRQSRSLGRIYQEQKDRTDVLLGLIQNELERKRVNN